MCWCPPTYCCCCCSTTSTHRVALFACCAPRPPPPLSPSILNSPTNIQHTHTHTPTPRKRYGGRVTSVCVRVCVGSWEQITQAELEIISFCCQQAFLHIAPTVITPYVFTPQPVSQTESSFTLFPLPLPTYLTSQHDDDDGNRLFWKPRGGLSCCCCTGVCLFHKVGTNTQLPQKNKKKQQQQNSRERKKKTAPFSFRIFLIV